MTESRTLHLKLTAQPLLIQRESRLFQNEWVIDFREFLLKKQHIPEKNVPYYLRWVAQYHTYCRKNPELGTPSKLVTSFVTWLATMIYTHVAGKNKLGVVSPLDMETT